ncbi:MULTISPECIES: single-stranded DNA-binding protein [Oceanobacillus]|uniref:single-stranded DNA-binding protein n=1 Tax=Oceanobacillus TaxID=182709 RepID=UPI0005960945|nr:MULTISPECIES: single-stranded DNA-binding protein [Oceanobacillus]
MMNNVQLIGRLVKDADLRYTPNGKAVANFTIAVNRPFSNQEGNREADFINCVVWNRPAENLANYCKKGSQVGLIGRMQTRTYDKDDGTRAYITEVVSDFVEFLDTRNGNQNNPYQGKNQNQKNPYQNQQKQKQNNPSNNPFDGQSGPIDISDDDLPF